MVEKIQYYLAILLAALTVVLFMFSIAVFYYFQRVAHDGLGQMVVFFTLLALLPTVLPGLATLFFIDRIYAFTTHARQFILAVILVANGAFCSIHATGGWQALYALSVYLHRDYLPG